MYDTEDDAVRESIGNLKRALYISADQLQATDRIVIALAIMAAKASDDPLKFAEDLRKWALDTIRPGAPESRDERVRNEIEASLARIQTAVTR